MKLLSVKLVFHQLARCIVALAEETASTFCYSRDRSLPRVLSLFCQSAREHFLHDASPISLASAFEHRSCEYQVLRIESANLFGADLVPTLEGFRTRLDLTLPRRYSAGKDIAIERFVWRD